MVLFQRLEKLQGGNWQRGLNRVKNCSDWTKFHEELNFLKHLFSKNGYLLSFIDKCFRMAINKLVIEGPQVAAAKKKILIPSLPYLGDISLQIRNKLRKSFSVILNYCKLQIVSKSQGKLANAFRFKDRLAFDLVSRLVYKYTWRSFKSSYYGEIDRHLKVRSSEQIWVNHP